MPKPVPMGLIGMAMAQVSPASALQRLKAKMGVGPQLAFIYGEVSKRLLNGSCGSGGSELNDCERNLVVTGRQKSMAL